MTKARAAPFIYYGGQTPCSTWLATADTYRQGLAWIMGAWSGLNLLGGLRHDTYDVGHTLTADQVANAVQYSCRRDMSMDMNSALIEAYVSARVQKR